MAVACHDGHEGVVRIICIFGAARDCPRGSAEELARGNVVVLDFLVRTRNFVNPLEYSEDLTVDEARFWLCSERLRDFPQFAFVRRGSPACNLIGAALVWSADAAALFPAACRRRARELVFILWNAEGLERSIIVKGLLPFLIDR